MAGRRLLIYDDEGGRWGPLTECRPIFALRLGVVDIQHRIERAVGMSASGLRVPQRLASVVSELYPTVSVNDTLPDGGDWLVVNGRWPGVACARQVRDLEPGRSLAQSDGQVVAARLNRDQANTYTNSCAPETPITPLEQVSLIERPWHALDQLEQTLLADLEAADPPVAGPGDLPGVGLVGSHPVRIGPGVRLMPSVVIDAEQGPVVIDRGAVVNAFTVLQGPCYIGRDTVLASHTSIRRNTVVGPMCRIGGEVSFSCIHGHTNKAHSGFLGHAIVGSWCNIGADTNVSNLKNTYGPVRMKLGAKIAPEDSGRTFLGPVIGDFVRTAISTRLPTGAVIGTGCCISCPGTAPTFSPSLGFYADDGRVEHDVDKFIATARRMMGRRGVAMTASQEALLRGLSAQPQG